ncbi:MAG: alanine--tRNA ligase [Lachnospiraceae bacterium]|nr:alanine--tRNA ligase [Lachnospiraceae bacterium]
MTAQELRTMYLNFFRERGHREIPSASLLPENDPTVLFTTAGMHPLVPYLLGEKHPLGRRLTDVQKCVRTCDIDEVGDDVHLIFFEMMGNWSLGDYSKEESVSMSFEFLTQCLHIPPERLAVTVFAGDAGMPRDQETERLWKSHGLTNEQIFPYGREENWWGPVGHTGPCGPDTEIFYDCGKPKCSESCGPACHCGKYVEIWNNVFLQFNQEEDGRFTELKQKNVDTGMGLERVLTILNGKTNVYETELFWPLMERLEALSESRGKHIPQRDRRIIAEHVRAVTFILGDPKRIAPSNTEQGYILRRLIRRVIRLFQKAGIESDCLCSLSDIIIGQYRDVYPELGENRDFILEELRKEHALFSRTLEEGLRKANRYLDSLGAGSPGEDSLRAGSPGENSLMAGSPGEDSLAADPAGGRIGTMLSGELAFKLYDTYGFPIEFTAELARERGFSVDEEGFRQKFEEHQEKSRKASAGKFAGGLAEHSAETARLHTATHLLGAALRKVLGEEVAQRGSNITAQRLRFDFSYARKVTKEELARVEAIVNQAISRKIDVVLEEISPQEAWRTGAVGVFSEKYGDLVKVYAIPGYSREICGGPHAGNTGELGRFRILKEEASSAGVRRIKAVLEPDGG